MTPAGFFCTCRCKRGFDAYVGNRVRAVCQRGNAQRAIGIFLFEHFDIVEIKRSEGAGFNADRCFAPCHPIGTSVAFAAFLDVLVDVGSVVGTGHRAVAAADAFAGVDADESPVVFVHSARGAHVNAFGSAAVIAGKREVVHETIVSNAAVGVLDTKAALVINNAPIAKSAIEILVVIARHFAGFASGAAGVIKEKTVLHEIPDSLHGRRQSRWLSRRATPPGSLPEIIIAVTIPRRETEKGGIAFRGKGDAATGRKAGKY